MIKKFVVYALIPVAFVGLTIEEIDVPALSSIGTFIIELCDDIAVMGGWAE